MRARATDAAARATDAESKVRGLTLALGRAHGRESKAGAKEKQRAQLASFAAQQAAQAACAAAAQIAACAASYDDDVKHQVKG